MEIKTNMLDKEVNYTFIVMLSKEEIEELKSMEKTYSQSKLNVYICRQNPEWAYYFFIKNYKLDLETDLGIETIHNVIKQTNKFESVKEMAKYILENVESLSVCPV